MSKNQSAWPLPSESRRVQAFLYSAEGACVGGVLGTLFDLLVLRVVDLVPLVRLVHAVIGVGFVVIGAFLFVRRLGVREIVRRTPGRRNGSPSRRSLSPVVRDWQETREWTLVVAIAVLTLAAILGTSLAFWGWESMVSDRAVGGPSVGAIVVGIALHVYSWRRLGEF